MKIRKWLFILLIAIIALGVSGSAAFYSVSGLSKLFAGASLAVIIMASTLEAAKLVVASVLYQYRKALPVILKIYLTVACVVLIGITSMGIYGFLSSAYQETFLQVENIERKIELVETKKSNYQARIDELNKEKSELDESLKELRKGLSNNVIQYKDQETGQIITTTSTSTRRALEKQAEQASKRSQDISIIIDSLNYSLLDFENEIIEIRSNSDLSGELGPLVYLSKITGKPMEKIVNYLLLVIVFVFDPLAVALVITANFVYEKELNSPLRSQTGSVHNDATPSKRKKTRSNTPNSSLYSETSQPLDENKPISSTGDASIPRKEASSIDTEKTNRNERTEETSNEPISGTSEEYRKEQREIVMGSQNAATKKRMLHDLAQKYKEGFGKEKEDTKGS